MRILHIGPAETDHDQQSGLRDALRELGPYSFVPWRSILQGAGPRVVQLAVIGAAHEHEPELVFLQDQRGRVDAATLRKIHAPIFDWSGDVRDPLPEHYLGRADAVSVTAFSNVEDVETVAEAGHRAAYWQVGVNTDVYRPRDCEKLRIVFIGSDYGDKFPMGVERREMVTELHERYERRFQVYGGRWPGRMNAYRVDQYGEIQKYQRCRVAISQSQFLRRRYFSDRLLRAMACGAMVLNRRFPEQELEFTEGVHFRSWETIQELCELIDYYCDDAHEQERAEIAAAGCAWVRETASWRVRVREMVGMLEGEEK